MRDLKLHNLYYYAVTKPFFHGEIYSKCLAWKHYGMETLINFYSFSLDQDLAMKFFNPETIKEGLMNLDWEHNPQYARELQYSVLNSTVVGISITENVSCYLNASFN